VDVGDFFELQRALERDRIAEAAAEEEEVLRAVVLLGQLAHVFVALERAAEVLRQPPELVGNAPRLGLRERGARAADADREQEQRDELAGEGLRRGDADLRPRVGHHDARALAGDRRTLHVADADGLRVELDLRAPQRRERVRRLARLADGDHERPRVDDRVAVAELGRVVDFDRDAREPFEEELADERRVPRRAAREQHDAVEVPELVVAEVQAVELDVAAAFVDPPEQRVGNDARLLVDLLLHVVVVAGLFGLREVPRHRRHRTFDARPVEAADFDRRRRDRRHIAVVEVDDALRRLDHRRDVAREEVAVGREADDQRAVLAGADHLVGMPAVDRGDREGPFEVVQRAPHGLGEVAVVVLFDEVRDDLAVRLGLEDVPALDEPLAQLAVVLDDAVMDGDDVALPAAVRVRVRLARLAVGRPARVADAGAAEQRRSLQHVLEPAQLADLADDAEFAPIDDGDARRVVAPIFEAF
jgi:hypothetical protein